MVNDIVLLSGCLCALRVLGGILWMVYDYK